MPERPRLIDLEIEDRIATLVLNRPEKLNAWSWESARQIAAHADTLRFDDSVRCVIVRAEGRAFCAGVDLGMPEDRITGRSPAEKVRNYYEKFRWVHERFNVLTNLPQPVFSSWIELIARCSFRSRRSRRRMRSIRVAGGTAP